MVLNLYLTIWALHHYRVFTLYFLVMVQLSRCYVIWHRLQKTRKL